MAIHITVVILVLDRDVFNSTLATLCSGAKDIYDISPVFDPALLYLL